MYNTGQSIFFPPYAAYSIQPHAQPPEVPGRFCRLRQNADPVTLTLAKSRDSRARSLPRCRQNPDRFWLSHGPENLLALMTMPGPAEGASGFAFFRLRSPASPPLAGSTNRISAVVSGGLIGK